jgi:hypothetical protein
VRSVLVLANWLERLFRKLGLTQQAGIGRGITAGAKCWRWLGRWMKPGEAAIAGGLAGLASGVMRPSPGCCSDQSGEVLGGTCAQPDGRLGAAAGSRGVMLMGGLLLMK